MLKNLLAAVFGLSLIGAANAGTQNGTVDALHIRASDGLVYFTLKGSTKTGSPACATIAYWMIKDENSAAGKRHYAALLAAQMSGKTIYVTGSNTCSRWSDGEDVDNISIAQ